MSLTFNNILNNSDEYNPQKNSYKIIIIVLSVFLSLLFITYLFAFSSPTGFGENKVVVVKEGSSLERVATELKENKIIKSEFTFKIIVRLIGGQSGAKSGSYFFKEPQNVLTVARRIAGADFRLTPMRVTIPEGSTIIEMSEILQISLGDSFDKEEFLKLTKGQTFLDNDISDNPFGSLEGFLFPDTYFFFPGIKNSEIISEMRRNFDTKMSPEMREEIVKRGLSIYDVITMASLIEEEARLSDTRRLVSGILWKRLSVGMALQVDAVFPYIIGKNTFEVTLDDLKIDSPYNTYLYAGLPKGPISNPGLDSILSAVYPKDSDYWYYLSDKDGDMHYAKTFDEHKVNKEKYLR